MIFVSRAVCHVLTYTAYTHAHTTDTGSLVIECRVNDLLIIEFVNLFVQRWKQLLRPSRITTRATHSFTRAGRPID